MKWNKNAASQKGRVFRSGLLSTAMLAAVLVLAVLLGARRRLDRSGEEGVL